MEKNVAISFLKEFTNSIKNPILHGLDKSWAVVSTTLGRFSFLEEPSVPVFGVGFKNRPSSFNCFSHSENRPSFPNFRKNLVRWFSTLLVLTKF
jgi:hypothetical protein